MSTTRVPVNGISKTYINRNRKEKAILIVIFWSVQKKLNCTNK